MVDRPIGICICKLLFTCVELYINDDPDIYANSTYFNNAIFISKTHW